MNEYPNLQRWLERSAHSDAGLALVLVLVGLVLGTFVLFRYMGWERALPLLRLAVVIVFFVSLAFFAARSLM